MFGYEHIHSTSNERAFCKALLNNDHPIWFYDTKKNRRKGFYLPPDDFVYGYKHQKQNGITGVAQALQYNEIPDRISKSISIPDFIAINKKMVRLGLIKVHQIRNYRKSMNEKGKKFNCYNSQTIRNMSIPDMTHGRVSSKQESIRDVIEHKFFHEWIQQSSMRRCQAILNKHIRVK